MDDAETVPTVPDFTGRPRVLVVGAGFAGLEAVRALAHAPVDVTLIDRRNFHLFQPLLYQVATAALSPGDIAWPIRTIVARQSNVTVLMMEVCGIDIARRCVTDGVSTVPYDFLVLATGASHSYFGHAEWEPFAPGLKTIADARGLRERLLLAFERAERAESLDARRRDLCVAVIGGGATGVEMAGAVVELARRALRSEFRRIDPARTRVVLIEAGPRLLPAFPDRLAGIARGSLEMMGVEVITGTAVTGIDGDGILAGGNRIEAGTVIWAAGVRASAAAAWTGAGHDRAGRVLVQPDLSIPGHPEIFVAGDTAAATYGDGRAVPGLAAAAKQMGAFVGRTIGAKARGRATSGAFTYRHQGDLATIGRGSAIVSLGRIQLSGFVGWLFWSLVHILFLIGFRSRLVVAIDWLWSFLTYRRGVRLISDRSPGPLRPPASAASGFPIPSGD